MDELQSSQFTKFQTMMRNLSRWWTGGGFLALLLLMTGCDPCMNNPCDDGLACNGLEICTANSGVIGCQDGTPVSCTAPAVCTEPDGACVVDGDETDEGTTDDTDQGTTDGYLDPDDDADLIDGGDLDLDDSTVQVDVLQLGAFSYPTGLFRCAASEDPQDPSDSCPQGAGCDESHWHSDTVSAILLTTGSSAITTIDPNPCKCGHGKASEVTRTTIEIDRDALDNYLGAANLDVLPTMGACPP